MRTVAMGPALSCAFVAAGCDPAPSQETDASPEPDADTDAANPLLPVLQLAPGAEHTCALDFEKHLWCWGTGSAATDAPGGTFVRVASAMGYSCALEYDDGLLQCWGDDPGTVVASAPPALLYELSVGPLAACGLDGLGRAVCWGDDASGIVSGAPDRSGLIAVIVGTYAACAFAVTGELECWGSDAYGLVSGAPIGQDVRDVEISGTSACAVLADGGLSCWGEGPEAPSGSFTEVEGSETYACALDADAEATCWGDGAPAGAPAGPLRRLSVGLGHACATLEEGGAVCWGANDGGQTDVPAELR